MLQLESLRTTQKTPAIIKSITEELKYQKLQGDNLEQELKKINLDNQIFIQLINAHYVPLVFVSFELICAATFECAIQLES